MFPVPMMSEMDSIEKAIIQVWSRPFSFHGKSNAIEGTLRKGDTFMAIVSPSQDFPICSAEDSITLLMREASISFEMKKWLFTILISLERVF